MLSKFGTVHEKSNTIIMGDLKARIADHTDLIQEKSQFQFMKNLKVSICYVHLYSLAFTQ